MDLVRVGEDPAGALVHHQRIILPRIPVTEDALNELVRSIVAHVMRQVLRGTHVHGFGIVQGGDYIPRGASAYHEVECLEGPRDMERLVVGG